MSVAVRPSQCHPERREAARGMCKRCYTRFLRTDASRPRATCHPDKPAEAHGMCHNCLTNKDYHTNPLRREARWRSLGIDFTTAEYDLLLISQNGVCAICHKAPRGSRLCVDHDHDTGKVRGLLCTHCNLYLAGTNRTPKLLRDAADYLERSTCPQ